MPVYGNWCGPRYGGGMPVDALDSCCKQHDDCYDNTSYYRWACWLKLNNFADNLIRRQNKSSINQHQPAGELQKCAAADTAAAAEAAAAATASSSGSCV
jgi:hypothetical protein